MNVFKRLLVSTLALFFVIASFAQGRTITGRLTGEDGQPLSGVTVRVKGTNRSTQTDASGNYSITAAPGDVLQFTYVGYNLSESRVDNDGTVNARLARTDNTLETVTVAMDIKRNPKELSFSTAKVAGSELVESQRENFVNGLQGRVAGLTINPTSGIAGASSQIVLRGFNSLALDNSPLFVLDGVIVDNSTMSENHGGGGQGTGLGLASAAENRSNDYTNRIADINPNDIESITVLKGPEATAMYGSQASSGAIIITTKKPATGGRLNLFYDNALRVSKLTRFPKVQNTFSAGRNGQSASALGTDFFFYGGPAYIGNNTFYNNIDNFFETGLAQTHNLAAELGTKVYSVRLSGSVFDQKGVIPNNDFKRYTGRINGSVKLGTMLELVPSFAYTRSENNKVLRGSGSYMLNLLLWPPTDDARNYATDSGFKRVLFNSNPNAELDNPFFNVHKNKSYDETDRKVTTLGVNFNPFKWLSAVGRFGYDTYTTTGYTQYDSMSFYLTRALKGRQDNYYRDYAGYNHTIHATARGKWKDFTGRVMLGNMWQDYKTEMFSVVGNNLVDSKRTDSNNTNPATRIRLTRAPNPNYSASRQVAYFGEVAFSWKNAIFVNYSHRFEESSLFPKDFRNYNYPAGGISIIASDLLPELKGKVLSYLKFRGSIANTARSASPYSNQSVFTINTGSGGGFAYGFLNANEFLKPERQSTYEVGTEFRLFNNRISVDATYYNTKNTDLIVELFRSSYGSGFVLNTLNVGSNKNSGIEISVDAKVIERKDFRYSTRFNFNRMRNEVTSLPPNVPEFYISDTWVYLNARGGLVVGGPTTGVTAYGYARNKRGDILIDPTTGQPVRDDAFRVRGDRNPDFTLGWTNIFNYKNLRLSFLWDLKVGGDIFNATDQYLTRNMKSLRTEDRLTPRVVNGVLRDGFENSATPTPNNIAIIPYYDNNYYALNMTDEEFLEKDVNWFRLRDITLSYTFPKKAHSQLRFVKSLGAFITGNDLILLTNYTGADPSVNGNSAGTRGVGAFGFDFGNVGTPVSVNVGIKASF